MPKHTMPYWLAALDADTLADLLARRPESTEPRPTSLLALADRLSTTRSVRLVLERLDRMTIDVLTAAQAVRDQVTVAAVLAVLPPGTDRALVEGVFAEARKLGLAWPAEGDTYRLADPLRDSRSLRSTPLPLRLEPSAPRLDPVDPDVVDVAAGAAMLPTLRGVERLIEVCSTTPLQLLRTGGVGVKEMRRLAKTLGTDETRARLWLALAYHADLMDNDDGAILPTVDADGWLAGTPAEQVVPLLMTWWRMPGSPTMPDEQGKQPPALAHAYHDDDRQLRHHIVRWFAEQPEGVVLADTAELVALLCWRRPYLFGDARTFTIPFLATLAEAETLGVLAQGGLSSWGRALVSGEDVGVVGRWLPTPTSEARLQADLTAVVTGMPTAGLTRLLNLAADAGERDTASVWRFSPASVRRALDAGYTADRLLGELREMATHGVPQPLEYLVRDVARRHGELTVVPVECCVLAKDTALAAEIVAHRSLSGLGLRLLTPGVLASAKPVRETVSLLRQHGYAPVATNKSGTQVVDRVVPLRAERRPRFGQVPRPDPEPDLFLLATTLLDRGIGQEQESIDVGQFGAHLPHHELTLLTKAIEAETPVEIMYVDLNERRSRRVITPYSQAGDLLEAWCHMRDDERHFLISRIERVTMAPAID